MPSTIFSARVPKRLALSCAKYKRPTPPARRDTTGADSQLFICFGRADWLDGQYTVWGEVTEGMDVVDKIVAVDVVQKKLDWASEFGATATGVEKGFAHRYGYEVAATELYTSPPASLDAELLRIRRVNPDVVFGQNYLVDAIMVIRTLKEMRWFPPAIVVHDAGWVVPDFLQTVGNDGNYIITRVSWALGMGARKPPRRLPSGCARPACAASRRSRRRPSRANATSPVRSGRHR